MSGPGQMLRDQIATLRSEPIVLRAGSALSRLAEIGTAGYPPDTRRRLMILNLIAYLIAITTAIYALQDAFLDYEKYKPVVWTNVALVALAFVVPLAHRWNDIAGALLILVAEYVALLLFAMYLGRSSGVQLQYFVIPAASFVVLGLERLWMIVPIILVALLLHLAAWFWYPHSEGLLHADRELLDSIYVQAAITTAALIGASVWYAFRLAENARAEVDRLLRNVLPDPIVERLKARPTETIADSFSEASILFADISGFVALARSLGASRTVALLNDIVTEFDQLAERHGVEKIKTIGDAYMAAAGIPEPAPDHLERLAAMALDMLDVVDRVAGEHGADIRVRIGMASGPVMAGIIGKQKFTYDVWGDSVNLASRLEALSSPGRILLCPACKDRLSGRFRFEPRGPTDIKGVGLVETWFLAGRIAPE